LEVVQIVMKVINSRRIQVSNESKNSVKSEIRIKKNNDKFIIKTVLFFSILNFLVSSVVLISVWDKVISWLQK
jgi:hypothetical protein